MPLSECDKAFSFAAASHVFKRVHYLNRVSVNLLRSILDVDHNRSWIHMPIRATVCTVIVQKRKNDVHALFL